MNWLRFWQSITLWLAVCVTADYVKAGRSWDFASLVKAAIAITLFNICLSLVQKERKMK